MAKSLHNKKSTLHPANSGGVTFEFIKPYKVGDANISDHSSVTIVNYCGKKVMLTGDNDKASWKELLFNSKFRATIENVDIFLASHHGRSNGFHEELFKYFKPKLFIISDSRNEHKSAISNTTSMWRRRSQ
jgi:beta-lactamase superfamily II metal-dependent hydrolase